MTDILDWQSRVGDVWAAEWRRTDRSFADLAQRLDAAARTAAPHGANVLDIGSGAGATSCALMASRPDVSITGIDLSPALVRIAAERVPAARFRVADAAVDPLDVAPDLLMSRHGVMFFADPVAAFAHLRAEAAAGARLVFSCFGAIHRNAFAYDLPQAVLGAVATGTGDYAPGPFGFADPDRVGAILRAAGWCDATPEAVSFDYIAGEGPDPVADAAEFLSRIGPLARALADIAPAERPSVVTRLRTELARYRRGDRIVLPAFALLWRAHAEETGKTA